MAPDKSRPAAGRAGHTPPAAAIGSARWAGSVGQHIVVVGFRVDVVTGLVGVGPWDARRGKAGRGVVPDAEMAEDFLDDAGIVDHGEDATPS